MRRESQLIIDGLILGTGVLVISLTLYVYNLSSPAFSPRPTMSKAEADRQIDSAKAYLTTHPEDFEAMETLALAYYQKGPDYYVDAMNALEKARSLGATDEHLFFYAGVMYDALGLPEYAVNEFSKYLRHHPNDYETMVRLGNVQFHQKNYESALTLYKQALHEWPKDPTVWFNYAIVNKEKNNYSMALSALDQVQRIAGRLPEGGIYEKGEIYRLQGDEAHANVLYQEELAKNPDFLPAVQVMEMLARKRGDYKFSKALRKRIAEIKSQNQSKNIASPPASATPAVAPAPPIVPSPPPRVKLVPVKSRRSLPAAPIVPQTSVSVSPVSTSTPTAPPASPGTAPANSSGTPTQP